MIHIYGFIYQLCKYKYIYRSKHIHTLRLKEAFSTCLELAPCSEKRWGGMGAMKPSPLDR